MKKKSGYHLQQPLPKLDKTLQTYERYTEHVPFKSYASHERRVWRWIIIFVSLMTKFCIFGGYIFKLKGKHPRHKGHKGQQQKMKTFLTLIYPGI